MTAPPSMFRTAEGRARYFAAYDATLALWPARRESFDVPTRFGPTHVLSCGPQDAPPLVLLPGQAVSSTMWYPNAGVLSEAFRVYAPDIVGDMGKSIRVVPKMSPEAYDGWLVELLDGLQLDRAHVAGLSFGGYLALRLARTTPERVRKLVLMAPAGLVPIQARFFLRMAALFLPISLPTRQRLLLGIESPNAFPVVRQMVTRTDFRYSMFLPPMLADEELARVRTPALLLMGEHEVVYDSQALIDRARRWIPDLEAEGVPGAGHALSLDQPERVNGRILAFLRRRAGQDT